MSDGRDDRDERSAVLGRPTSLGKLLGISGGVFLLIGLGVLVGAVLWPRAVTVEKRVIAPIRQVTTRASPAERLPDLVDAACPAIALVTPPLLPASPPPAHGHHASTHHAHGATPPAPANAFVVSEDGYLVTAAGTVGTAASVPVTLPDGPVLPASVVQRDPLSGIALLKIDAHDLVALRFVDEDLPRIGTWGFALSSPHGTGCRATAGIIGSDFVTERASSGALLRVSPAPADIGVGSPFLAADGRVLGMWIKPPGATDPGELLSGRIISRIASGWMRGGGPSSFAAWGMVVDDLTPTLARRLGIDGGRGAAIIMIDAGSPADDAGLQVGDVILAVGQSPVSGATEAARSIDPAATAVTLQILRGSTPLAVTLRSK